MGGKRGRGKDSGGGYEDQYGGGGRADIEITSAGRVEAEVAGAEG